MPILLPNVPRSPFAGSCFLEPAQYALHFFTELWHGTMVVDGETWSDVPVCATLRSLQAHPDYGVAKAYFLTQVGQALEQEGGNSQWLETELP